MRDFPSASEILQLFAQHPERTFRLRELVVELGLRSSQARQLKSALQELSRQRKIVRGKKSHYSLGHASGDHRHARLRETTARSVTSVRANIITGRLIGHRDGYAFVVPDRQVGPFDQDIFIPPGATGSAMHGDRVEVHVVRARARSGFGRDNRERDERLEGRVIRVTERAQRTVVGEFRCGQRSHYVVPFDQRIPFEILIPRGQEWPAEGNARDPHRQYGGESEGRIAARGSRRDLRELEGRIVDVELTTYPDPVRGIAPRGRVIEILGRRGDFGVDVEMVIRKHHLPHRFPPEVLVEAAAVPQFISERDRRGRRDFRSLPVVTIDGETAKDFDDAVYVERLAGRHYRLQVHIADVAHYVRPGTELDREARLRGTSVYFPDRAVPMLPLELSNGICSLNPRVERLTMSVLMEIDAEGRVTAYELVPGVIRSVERMTYTAVHAILSGDAAACQRYGELADQFHLMEELAGLLNRQRDARGSIDFDLPEPEIEFDAQGRMVGITRSERNTAHRIIEEFMLAANEAVAAYLEGRGIATLYRVHEKPDPKKVLEFEDIAASFGYSLGIEAPAMRRLRVGQRDAREPYPRFYEALEADEIEITSRHYQRLTQRLAGRPEERILSYLMLRSLKQARYSEENLGHFALAAPVYTHFTSPIRRYPDLIVHRILKAALEREGGSVRVRAGESSRLPSPPRRPRGRVQAPASASEAVAGAAFVNQQELRALALETSEAERRAAEAERELMEWKKVVFMSSRLGDEFDGLIISLTRHGCYVELLELFVEGFVPIESLGDDRYVYRERWRAMVGRQSGRAYRLGDRVRVRLDRIERDGNKLLFSFVP